MNTGTTLTEAHEISVYVQALLTVRGQSSGGNVSSGLADFSHSEIFNVDVPAEVDWSSESGVFLSQAVSLCEENFDDDRDVDGVDLAGLAADPGLLELDIFAENFGRTDCPQWYMVDGLTVGCC